ncbi:MAG: AAA family ATPase, partial [Candidatus Dadabacteria bacterium]|nr:AAA family ATPase [Candidatus Dadabacteria bacterium]
MLLAEKIKISKTFQQSARIDTDLEIPEALDGFVFHNSAKYALQRMAQMAVESNRRAFTCTGPYGAGKSSLALVLCASLTNNSLSCQAKKLTKELPYFEEAFPSDESGWLVIPLVGHRGDLVNDLRKNLFRAEKENQTRQSAKTIIKLLRKKAEERPGNGVLLVIDEMGKYLEEAAQEGGDIHFFQELAESASRTKGRLVVLGILHQSFEQYTSRLGEKARKEWTKVQGRYVDIPLVTAVEEVVDLIGKAIDTDLEHPENFVAAEIIANSIRNRRAGIPSDFATYLDSCWPVHPATAVLLGPLSRWRFGQNERSVFGFLGSSEPEGFQDFLKSTEVMGTTYEPWRLWNYLKTNLESAIMASADSHRWAQSVEAVALCEAKGTPLHVKLAKTVAVIEMFRHGSGLMPENEILKTCVADTKKGDVGKALKDIEKWSAVIFRKHFNSWAIYAGSDFDIESSLQKELVARKLNIEELGDLVQMRPAIAKKHYHETGTLRWFKVEIVSAEKACNLAKNFHPTDGTAGAFFLVVPTENNYSRENIRTICKEASKSAVSGYPVAVGFSSSYELINDLGKELSALHDIKRNNPELEGDSVARLEIEARITVVKERLQTILKTSLNKTRWFVGGSRKQVRTTSSLSVFASNLADKTFPYAPKIRTELVNREKPSGNGQAAIRKLLYGMVNHPNHKDLYIKGSPSELGIYRSILEALYLHGKTKNGAHRFLKPLSGNKNKRIFRLWKETENILKENQIVPIS